ncbi:OmpA family protein [Paraburkholderia sp. IW21]|uniref:OmpA family protein n=1 Tax=Paraburkholderia sp. IW21 TaxID=3242488 RepID=UPI003521C9FA
MTGTRLAGYPYRTLCVWIATLALIWLALCSPWPFVWNGVCAALVVLMAVVAIVIATRRIRERQQATRHVLSAIDTALASLPSDIKRNTPLIIAVGDAPHIVRTAREARPEGAPLGEPVHADGSLADLFGSDLVRITDTAIWVRSDDPARLAHLADALKRWRDGQGPDAVAYPVAADRVDSQPNFAAALKQWRGAIAEASRAVGYPLPVCVAVYAEEVHSAAGDCPWFGVSGGSALRIETLSELVASRLEQYMRMGLSINPEPRARRAAQLDALTRWACDAVLPALVDAQRGSQPLHVTGFGVTAIEGRPGPHSLYRQFVSSITGLTLSAANGRRLTCPLPEPLIRGIPPQPARRTLPRALAHAFACLAACFCAAAAASAWQNRALVERVVGDMSRYKAIAPAQNAARVDALTAVKRDRDELERYATSGVPPRLGLGLYRGAPLQPVANALIASYQPPAPPPPTIELDSLSLFSTGKAVLNPGSNRVLVRALEMIKAYPDKRVLVAGHTDSVGHSSSNLKLSEARAASVRDWLADASGIPATHFAIQGYGDTRPKAPNDTEAGRASNRRVEITLIPDCRDDRSNGLTPQGHPACSFE